MFRSFHCTDFANLGSRKDQQILLYFLKTRIKIVCFMIWMILSPEMFPWRLKLRRGEAACLHPFFNLLGSFIKNKVSYDSAPHPPPLPGDTQED